MSYDKQCVAGRFLGGDPRAYSQVLGWISRVIFASRFRGVRQDSLDLQQEVFRRILESLRQGRFDPGQDFRTYVQSVTRYTARDELFNRQRQVQADPEETRGTITPAIAEDRAIRRQQVEAVMARIPRECQELLTLFFYEQCSYAEIADVLNVPLGTVKSRLCRCIKRAADSASRRTGSVRRPRRIRKPP